MKAYQIFIAASRNQFIQPRFHRLDIDIFIVDDSLGFSRDINLKFKFSGLFFVVGKN